MVTQTNSRPNEVLHVIHARNAKHKAKIFTYTMGPALSDPAKASDWTLNTATDTYTPIQTKPGTKNIDPRLPQAMACATGGAWTHIHDPLLASESMLSFYSFLSLNVESTQTRWTAPFTDPVTGKSVTAAMKPAYDRSVTGPSSLCQSD